MLQKRMGPILLTVLIFTVLLTGCVKSGGNVRADSTGTGSGAEKSVLTKDDIFKLYNMTQLDKSKADLNNTLKVTGIEDSQVKNSYTYTDTTTGFGVYITYGDNDISTSKTLVYPKTKDLAILFTKQVTQKQADDLTKDMDYFAVKNALGEEGIERNVTESKYGGDTHMYYWVNKDGSLIQAIFGKNGKLISEMFTN